jgi:hypothetical protein
MHEPEDDLEGTRGSATKRSSFCRNSVSDPVTQALGEDL